MLKSCLKGGKCFGYKEIKLDAQGACVDVPGADCIQHDPTCEPDCVGVPKAGFTCPTGFDAFCVGNRNVCGLACTLPEACGGGEGFRKLVPAHNAPDQLGFCEPRDANLNCPQACSEHIGRPDEECAAPVFTHNSCANVPGRWHCNLKTGGDFQCLPNCAPSQAGCGPDGYGHWNRGDEMSSPAQCVDTSNCTPWRWWDVKETCLPECQTPGEYRNSSCQVWTMKDGQIEKCGDGQQVCDQWGFWSPCGLPCGNADCGKGITAGLLVDDRCEAVTSTCQYVTKGSSSQCCRAGEDDEPATVRAPSGELCEESRRYCHVTADGNQWSAWGKSCMTCDGAVAGAAPHTIVCRGGNSDPYPVADYACIAPEHCNGCDDNKNALIDEEHLLVDPDVGDPCTSVSNTACTLAAGFTACVDGKLECAHCAGTGSPLALCSESAAGAMNCGYESSCAGPSEVNNACGACAPTHSTLTFGTDGYPTNRPGACWRPFANSPFYQEIPTWATVVDGNGKNNYWENQAVAQHILSFGPPPEITAQRDGVEGGEPTYYANGSVGKRYVIDCDEALDPWGDPNDGDCAVEGLEIRLPLGAMPEHNRLPNVDENGATISDHWQWHDGHLTVIDTLSNKQIELFQVWDVPIPTTGTEPIPLKVSWGSVMDLSDDGIYAADPGAGGTFSEGVGRNGTAAYFATSVGRIRLEELMAGEINHALFLVVQCQKADDVTGKPVVVYPSTGYGARLCTGANNASAPALGQRVFYNRDIEFIQRLPVSTWKKTILKALRRYGAFISDTGDGWSFEFESGSSYGTANASKWYDWAIAERARGEDWHLWDNNDPGPHDDRAVAHFAHMDPNKPQAHPFPSPLPFECSVPGVANCENAIIIKELQNHLQVLKPCVTQGTCN